jgi:hypothetical protein
MNKRFSEKNPDLASDIFFSQPCGVGDASPNPSIHVSQHTNCQCQPGNIRAKTTLLWGGAGQGLGAGPIGQPDILSCQGAYGRRQGVSVLQPFPQTINYRHITLPAENLAAAIPGETHEFTKMYPPMSGSKLTRRRTG